MKSEFTEIEKEITKNFKKIYDKFSEDLNFGKTSFSKKMGYSSTSQLDATLNGEALISTKAIIGLVNNLKVNPGYLFTGQGEMFLMDDTEIDKLKQDNFELTWKLEEAHKTMQEQENTIKKLEQRNNDIIELSSAAIKYIKEHKDDIKETEK